MFPPWSIYSTEQKTISPDKGLFLEKTWRLHPKLCDFTSEVFYEGRLRPREGLEHKGSKGILGWANRVSGSFQLLTRAIGTLRLKRSSVLRALLPVLCKPV